MPKTKEGYGSNPRGAHAAGINKLGVLPVHPNALRVITKNPWGASVDPKTGRVPKDGYMVSVPGRTQFVDARALAGPQGEGILRNYARANADLLRQPGAFIGSWSDDGGKTHLDVSRKIGDRVAAIRIGRRDNQMAIWDNARKKLINTGGSGD